jgi:hypothetical protein
MNPKPKTITLKCPRGHKWETVIEWDHGVWVYVCEDDVYCPECGEHEEHE